MDLLLAFLQLGGFFISLGPVNAVEFEALGAGDGELIAHERGGGLAFIPQP